MEPDLGRQAVVKAQGSDRKKITFWFWSDFRIIKGHRLSFNSLGIKLAVIHMWDPHELIFLYCLIDSGKQPVHCGHLQGDLSWSKRSPDRCPISLTQHKHLWPAVHWGTRPGGAAPWGNLLPVSLSEPIREEEEPGAGSGGTCSPEDQPSFRPENRHSPGGGWGLRWPSYWERSTLHWTERAGRTAPRGRLCHLPALPLWFTEGGAAAGQCSSALHPKQRAFWDSSRRGHVLLLPCYRSKLWGPPGERGRWGDGLPVRAHGGGLL